MKAEFIDKMGTDLTVVNAARVSFDKESDWDIENDFVDDPDKPGYLICLMNKVLEDKDIRLINYLAKHNHWTPFSHVMIQMRETVPIFVARQRFKHVVGFTYNEVSRRYVDDTPQLYWPDKWRKAADNKKQGSSDEEFISTDLLWAENHMKGLVTIYNKLVKEGCAPEQARMILPQSMYTSYYVTGSLAAWARAYSQRTDPHAQIEIQELAAQWGKIIGAIPELKYSWEDLTNKKE